MKVKNVRYTAGGGAELVDMEVDEPGSGEVQVEVAACGICAWDIQTFRAGGDSQSAAPPGHEGVGYVSKLGPGVHGIEVGARVVGGGFARLRNTPVRSLYRIQDSELADEQWVVEPVSCVVTGMDVCRLRAGERIAMVGCGFMGLMMLQGLAGVGADQIIALDIDEIGYNSRWTWEQGKPITSRRIALATSATTSGVAVLTSWSIPAARSKGST